MSPSSKVVFNPKKHTKKHLIMFLEELYLEYCTVYLHMYNTIKEIKQKNPNAPDFQILT